jgi:hypothetical protein
MSVFDIIIQRAANAPELFPSAFYSDGTRYWREYKGWMLVKEPLSEFSIDPCPEQLRGLHLSEK